MLPWGSALLEAPVDLGKENDALAVEVLTDLVHATIEEWDRRVVGRLWVHRRDSHNAGCPRKLVGLVGLFAVGAALLRAPHRLIQDPRLFLCIENPKVHEKGSAIERCTLNAP